MYSDACLCVPQLEIMAYIKVVSYLSVNALQLQLGRQSGRATFTLTEGAIM